MQISSRRIQHHPGDSHDRLHDYFYVLKMHQLTSRIFTFSSALASDMTTISAEDTLEENEKLFNLLKIARTTRSILNINIFYDRYNVKYERST